MGKKTKLNKSYGRRKSSDGSHVNVRQTLTQTQSMNPNTALTNLGEVVGGSGGMWSTFESISQLCDMFRLEKINSVVFEFGPMTSTGSAAVNVPAGMLYFKYNGQAAPSTLTDIETPHVSKPSSPWSALAAAGSEAVVREADAYLRLKNKDMPLLAATSDPGYISTQSDGTATTYGTLFWAFLTTAASSTLTYFIRTYLDISFKDILDPSTISNLMNRYPSGLPPHITTKPGFIENCVSTSLKVGRPLRIRQNLDDQTPTASATAPVRFNLT
jgi:hypothetical protein